MVSKHIPFDTCLSVADPAYHIIAVMSLYRSTAEICMQATHVKLSVPATLTKTRFLSVMARPWTRAGIHLELLCTKQEYMVDDEFLICGRAIYVSGIRSKTTFFLCKEDVACNMSSC